MVDRGSAGALARGFALMFALLATMMLTVDVSYAADDKPMSQKDKMSACSKENKGKKGAEYKSAMSECLKK